MLFNLCISSVYDSAQLTHSRISFSVYWKELKYRSKNNTFQAIFSPGLQEFLFSHNVELLYHSGAFSLNEFYLSSLSNYDIFDIKQNIANLFSQIQSIVYGLLQQPRDYSSNNTAHKYSMLAATHYRRTSIVNQVLYQELQKYIFLNYIHKCFKEIIFWHSIKLQCNPIKEWKHMETVGIRPAQVWSWHYSLLAVWSWQRPFTSLSFTLLCQQGWDVYYLGIIFWRELGRLEVFNLVNSKDSRRRNLIISRDLALGFYLRCVKLECLLDNEIVMSSRQ